ncbi:MAG: thymidylate kinase [Pirellulaceae bacterium]|nr:MAG: thymidylate kinase [Pirellulaceae bacterium]
MSRLFLSIDGVDGAGKSTQIEMLLAWFASRGVATTAVRDPGGTQLGEQLRELLLHRQEVPLCSRAEMLLYMASRAQLVEEVIRPALDSNRTVLADRYLLANVVYQGVAGEIEPELIWHVGEVATGGLYPDLTIVLDLPVDVAVARLGAQLDRMESRGRDYLERVRQGFLTQGTKIPAGRFVVIDANQSADAIHTAIVEEIEAQWAAPPAAS